MDKSTSKFGVLRAMVMATAAALVCGAALAQWQWLDGTGRKVFSDTPPPVGTPDKSIIKRPGGVRSASAVAAISATSPTASTPTAATTTTPKLSGRDDQLEAKKKQAEEAEQAKKRTEAEKLAKARAENCDRAKRAKVTLDSGIRIATTNAKGEREVMDDKARAAEGQRIQDTIRSDCSPVAQ